MKSIVYLTSAAAAAIKTQDHCYALAMQEGGELGAYEAGVVWGMYYQLSNFSMAEKFQYDSLSGVSSGSMNTFFMSVWPKGEEE